MEYIRVEKNGIEDDMNKTVWDAIGGRNNKDGWREVINTPVEVLEIKSKKAQEVKQAPVEVIETSPEGKVEEVAEVVEVEVKAPIKASQVKSKEAKPAGKKKAK